MLGRQRIGQAVVQVQQPRIIGRKQQLGPLPLHARRTRHKQPVLRQIFAELLHPCRHLVQRKTACHCTRLGAQLLGMQVQPLRRFFDAHIANRVASACQQQRPICHSLCTRRQTQVPQQFCTAKTLGQHVHQPHWPLHTFQWL